MSHFIDYFDFLRNGGAKEHDIDGGFTFLLRPIVEADFSAGISLVDQKANHFISTGVSFRFE